MGLRQAACLGGSSMWLEEAAPFPESAIKDREMGTEHTHVGSLPRSAPHSLHSAYTFISDSAHSRGHNFHGAVTSQGMACEWCTLGLSKKQLSSG